MPNMRYSETKKSQRGSDECYEGEDGPSSERDSVKSFGTREQVNKMSGTGARTPDQAEYTVPKDQWRS
jgi:hypothetical protein